MPADKKHVATYRLNLIHSVSVGVSAPDGRTARAIAEKALSLGTLWDDSPQMPLLYDEYEEDEDAASQWQWEVREVGDFPPADASVTRHAARGKAFDACRALVAACDGILRDGGAVDGAVFDAVDTAREALALWESRP